VSYPLPATLTSWHRVFADDDARAFDALGWSYYTREWADGWYPGYSDAWGSLNGAIGILYEQASTDGQPLKRASGAVVTYRESVHHHAVSSLANLGTLRANRAAILRDYLAHHRRALAEDEPWSQRSFALVPGRNADREEALLRALLAQGVEVARAQDDFDAADVESTLRVREEQRRFPRGTLLVDARQPKGALVRAYLDFDPRMSDEFLLAERRELERKGASKVYDVTAWCLAQTLDVDGYWCRTPDVAREPLAALEPRAGGVVAPSDAGAPTAWIVDGRDDASVVFALAALELGLAVHLADERFTSAGRSFPRGSLVVRRHENEDGAEERVARAAASARVQAFATATGRSPDDGPDLGGSRFTLLKRPRVALLGGMGVDFTSYGAVWHLLDHELGMSVSLLDVAEHANADLRSYDALILPNTDGDADEIYAAMIERAKPWVANGGTLIAIGAAAAALADEELGLSATRRRADVLDSLGDYAVAAARARAIGAPVDPQAVWETSTEAATTTAPTEVDETSDAELDEFRAKFSPVGAIVRGELDVEHWITSGFPAEAPLFVAGPSVLLAKPPVETPVRLAPRERLRLSGLLWPEAVSRLADSAYSTVERRENGQVILFAQDPVFRGFWRGTRRLLINAVLLGPGCGTNPAYTADGG
jgi:hypothetical protein